MNSLGRRATPLLGLMKPSMTVMALDVGRTRIGMAVSDPGEANAHPLKAIERRSFQNDVAQIAVEVRSHGVSRVIVGFPLNMDGTEGRRAQGMRVFAERLGEALSIPVELHDERLTTFDAKERVRGRPMRRANRRRALDAIAAALILDSWLHEHPSRSE